VCVCNLIYPARKANAPYYIVICGLSGCTIFSTLSHKWHDFREKVTERKMCALIFSTNLSEIFLILRRIQRDTHKHTQVVIQSILFSCHNLIRLELYQQIFEKWSNIKFYGNPSSGRFSTRADGRTDMRKLVVASLSFANPPTNTEF